MNEKEFIKNFYNLNEINLKSRQLKNLYRILHLQKEKYNCIKESCILNGYNFIHIGDDYFNNIKIPENCDINEEIIKMFIKCIKGIKNEN